MQHKEIMIDTNNLRELTDHRTVVLPVACYETIIKQNIHGHIPLHWHNELQFVYVVEGAAVFHVNEDRQVVKQGEGIFINSGSLHMAEDQHHSGCVYLCLNVAPLFVLPQELFTTYVYPYVNATNLPFLFLAPSEPWAHNILSSIVTINTCIQQQPPCYEIHIVEHLASIWRNFTLNGIQLEYNQTEIIKNQRMKEMLNWIHMHYAEKIKLEDIAKAGNLSRSETCRYFKQILNTSPMQYVIEYRIKQSLVLLHDPESNVTDVGYRVGFNSTSYFIDKFRDSMNMTPLTYKNQVAHKKPVSP
ncbi:AraC family transcriptional regulator [Paenibacillus sp. EZ-K15]|uniref:AraC family transcriptional regulator n=1 Tax=Paenibacillus sp. EZ-K15 TaxID=2044275 RepID=UPI001F263804|nr:AraC family transcriptional regulator [Paenibacillus sp. EZ-K15]